MLAYCTHFTCSRYASQLHPTLVLLRIYTVFGVLAVLLLDLSGTLNNCSVSVIIMAGYWLHVILQVRLFLVWPALL